MLLQALGNYLLFFLSQKKKKTLFSAAKGAFKYARIPAPTMRVVEHLKQGLGSLQPTRYRKIAAQPYRQTIRTIMIWLLFSLTLMVIVSIPRYLVLSEELTTQLSSFTAFDVNTNIVLQEPITILHTPLVVVNPQQENMSDEAILINDQGILHKKAFWRGTQTTTWETILNIPSHAQTYAKWLTIAIIIITPTLLALLGLALLLELFVIIIATSVLAWLITKIARFQINFTSIIKVCTIASVPLIMLQIIPFFYIRWLFIPLGVYLLLVAISIWTTGESKLEKKLDKKQA
jgi:hypothetical protein